MSALPAPLRPWAASLSQLPADLALSLGAHVARLAPAVGALRPRGETRGGEPNGYDGLSRRGSPERLLLSEWVHALELPEEFLRRAAMGEQAYLQPAFRQPQGARRSVLLLDAGPSQLGAPRLAHLALLVLLARRAEAAGAAFGWGVLQRPEGALYEGFTPDTVRALLEARCAQEPDEAQLERWRAQLGLAEDGALAAEDLWLVGGPRLAALARGRKLARAEVREAWAPDARALHVALHPGAAPARTVELALPPPGHCTRLLRNPFDVAPAAQGVLVRGNLRSDGATLHFSARGRQLVLAERVGSVVALNLPSAPQAKAPRLRRFHPPEGARVVGAGARAKGGLLVATLEHNGRLALYGALKGNHSQQPLYSGPLPEFVSPPGISPLLSIRGQHYLRDGAGNAWVLSPEGRQLSAVQWLHFTALEEAAERLIGVRSEPHGLGTNVVVRPSAGLDRYHLTRRGARVSRVHLGYGAGVHGEWGMLALCDSDAPERWHLLSAESDHDLHAFSGTQVVGVCAPPGAGEGLLLLEEDGCTLSCVSREGHRTLWRAEEPLVAVRTCADAPLIASLTRRGALAVYSLKHGAPLLQLQPSLEVA